jgi:hypothetical protein
VASKSLLGSASGYLNSSPGRLKIAAIECYCLWSKRLAALSDCLSIVAITARNSEQKQRMMTADIAGKPSFPRRKPAFWLFVDAE